jgi:hypothetical protein
MFTWIGDLDGKFLSGLLSFGIVLLVAAAVGGGVKALGNDIPALNDWRKVIGAAIVGILVGVFAGYGLRLHHWNDRYDALVNGANGKPPPPWKQAEIQDGLNWLAEEAGEDARRNCVIADFISVHEITVLPAPVQRRLDASDTKSPAPDLQCFTSKVREARATVTRTTSNAGRISAATETAEKTPSTRILAAVTTKGDRGWIYAGTTAGPGNLGTDRTIREASIGVNRIVELRTSVKLHDPAAHTAFRTARTVGVVPAGSKVIIEQLPREARYQWALVRVVSVPPAHAV